MNNDIWIKANHDTTGSIMISPTDDASIVCNPPMYELRLQGGKLRIDMPYALNRNFHQICNKSFVYDDMTTFSATVRESSIDEPISFNNIDFRSLLLSAKFSIKGQAINCRLDAVVRNNDEKSLREIGIASTSGQSSTLPGFAGCRCYFDDVAYDHINAFDIQIEKKYMSDDPYVKDKFQLVGTVEIIQLDDTGIRWGERQPTYSPLPTDSKLYSYSLQIVSPDESIPFYDEHLFQIEYVKTETVFIKSEPVHVGDILISDGNHESKGKKYTYRLSNSHPLNETNYRCFHKEN